MAIPPFPANRGCASTCARRIDTLIVIGAATDVCVLTTVLGAVDHGYRVILATDALCSASDRTRRGGGDGGDPGCLDRLNAGADDARLLFG